ncbi:CVNH domain-containing protein [uncultured Nostoc sp.]|uniref:mannose-binding lectin n=1 Tax=uncultured Nostoc sp. TaxID=340711 RepID=UPI0035C96F14
MSNSFEKTCNEIFVNGNVLSATCQKLDKSPNKTSIVLMGIENIDGELKVTDPNKPSSFHLSCTEIYINGNVLSATCQKHDKSLNKTSIVLNGLENIDGELKYTSNVTDINSRRKAKMSNYVVILNTTILIGRGGATRQDFNFTLPDSANLDSSAVLIFTVDNYQQGTISFSIDLNGKTVTSASYNTDVYNSVQAVVAAGVLKTGSNVATLKVDSGDGATEIENIVLWFKYREY